LWELMLIIMEAIWLHTRFNRAGAGIQSDKLEGVSKVLTP